MKGGECGENEEKYRETVEDILAKLIPYELNLDPTTFWDLIIANEDKDVKKKKFTHIKIEKLKINSNSLMVPLNIIGHMMGEVVDLLPSEDNGYMDGVIFLPFKNGTVKKGDVLGIVKIRPSIPVEDRKFRELLKKWKGKIDNLENLMADSIESSSWPYW